MSSSSLPLVPWDRKSLLSARNSNIIIETTLTNVLDLMMLGRLEEGNKLISALNDHYSLQIEGISSYRLRGAIHYAWAASKKWPEFVISHDPSKPDYVSVHGYDGEFGNTEEFLTKLEEEDRHRWPKRIKDAYPDYTKDDLNSVIVELNGKEWPDQKAEILPCVLEIALTLGETDQAKDLIKEHAVGEYVALAENTKKERDYRARERRQAVAQSRQLWRLLLDGVISEDLDIDEKTLKEYVDEGVDIINTRLTNRPTRSLADKTIEELVDIMDSNYVRARKLDPNRGGHMIVPDFKRENVPETWLKPGASEEEIAELEEKLGDDDESLLLPDEYKEFLRVSNGYYEDAPNSQSGIFYGSSMVEKDAVLDEVEIGVNLIPYEYLSLKLIEAFSPWPEVGEVASLGAGGDEGHIALIPPNKVKLGIEHFNEVYEKARESDKRIMERACKDLYGGMNELRKLQWVVIDWAHWDPEPHVHMGFRGYLEDAVQYAIKEAEEAEHDENDDDENNDDAEDYEGADEEAADENLEIDKDDGNENDASEGNSDGDDGDDSSMSSHTRKRQKTT